MNVSRAFADRSKVFELAEAEQLLPVVRALAARIRRRVALRRRLERELEVLNVLNDVAPRPGPELHELVDKTVQYHRLGGQIDALAESLGALGCKVRGRDAHCVDFTCLRDDGLAVFCWRDDEEHVSHWHFMHEDHSARRPVPEAVAPLD
jgi:hypothetical protein